MLKVQVSPFLGISEWVDPRSGITFSKKAGHIGIPDGTDMTNINKYIRLNQLIYISGSMKKLAPEPKIDSQEPANEEISVEPIEKEAAKPIEGAVETVVETEEVAEAIPEKEPKTTSRKRSPKNKTKSDKQ